jgi:hypothetical protein
MFKKTLARFKPGVPRRMHIMLAASLWTGIGIMLMVRGIIWLIGAERSWLILPALALGTVKSIMVLDKTARRSLDRILRLADGTCLGAVYSVKTWMLISFMMLAGYGLRHSSLPVYLIGVLYMTIGWSLFMSSRHAWICWYHGV